MDNIKIGSIVKCNDRNMLYYDMTGLVYDIRYVGEQGFTIATVAFEYYTRTHEISTEFLTLIGEIEPECTALNYRPGTRLKLREAYDYIVHHIEISQESYQFPNITFHAGHLSQNAAFFKVFPIITRDNSIGKANVKDTSISANPMGITYDDEAKYFQNDISITEQAAKDLLNSIYGIHSKTLKEEIQMKTKSHSACNPIKKVIFNDPATIVFWKDGTKTVVKRQEGAEFDPEKGLAMAVCRHYLCDICGLERYDGVFKRYMPKEMKK